MCVSVPCTGYNVLAFILRYTIVVYKLFEGRGKFLETELWPGGPTFSSFKEDAACDVMNHSDKVVWDFFYTDYQPNFWSQLPLSGDKVWLNWHGTHQYGAVCSLSGNYLLKGEKQNGKMKAGEGPGKIKEAMYEITNGRGVYSSPKFEKARYTLLQIQVE